MPCVDVSAMNSEKIGGHRRSVNLKGMVGAVCAYGTTGSLCLKSSSRILLQFRRRDADIYVFYPSSVLFLEL